MRLKAQFKEVVVKHHLIKQNNVESQPQDEVEKQKRGVVTSSRSEL
jgi:hypothetical protein